MTEPLITFEFGMTPSQNTYQRWHFHRQHELKNLYRARIRQQLARSGLPFLIAVGRRKIVVRRYSVGRLDRGNLIGGCKALLDALRDEGVIRDDAERWLEDHYEQHPARRGQGRTEVEVSLLPG